MRSLFLVSLVVVILVPNKLSVESAALGFRTRYSMYLLSADARSFGPGVLVYLDIYLRSPAQAVTTISPVVDSRTMERSVPP